jgi:SnoaL-like domain
LTSTARPPFRNTEYRIRGLADAPSGAACQASPMTFETVPNNESGMHPFRTAVEARDTVAIESMLAEQVVFTSPVAFKPYSGKAITAAILRGVMRVFEDFRYEREIASADGRDHALLFRATVHGRDVHGCDFLHFDADGKIDDFTVMVRPLSGAEALAEAMSRQFERIEGEALGR